MDTVKQIMHEQFKRRSIKYRLFFTGLLLEKYFFKHEHIPDAGKRGVLLRNYYFLMRYLDDIIDGDITIPKYESLASRIAYLETKLAYANNLGEPNDNVDMMIKECYQLANEIGFSMTLETQKIIASLIFDGQRLLSWQDQQELLITNASELSNHFYDLDIIGTIGGSLKIYQKDEAYLSKIYPLGLASRKYYDLRDFLEDFKRGLINLAQEDLISFNIKEQDLYTVMNLPDNLIKICKDKGYNHQELINLIPQPILAFLDQGSNYCANQITEYHQQMAENELPPLNKTTVMALDNGFEKNINRYLKKIKHNQQKK